MAKNDDLILRGKALEDLRDIKEMLVAAGDPFLASVMHRAITCIESQPAVGAAKVAHGRWVAVPSSDMMTGKAYICSECKKMRYGSFMPNYCQNCGAKMDGGAGNG